MVNLLERIAELPTLVALKVTEDSCPCSECRSRGQVGWPTPLGGEPHHFEWTCGKHSLARMVHLRMLFKKRRAVFRPPSGKSYRDQANGHSVS